MVSPPPLEVDPGHNEADQLWMSLLNILEDLGSGLEILQLLLERSPVDVNVHLLLEVVGACPPVRVTDLGAVVPLPVPPPLDVVHPELLVEGAGDQAPLEQHLHRPRVATLLRRALDLKVQVVAPVLQLGTKLMTRRELCLEIQA